jgi:hypothetical protein
VSRPAGWPSFIPWQPVIHTAIEFIVNPLSVVPLQHTKAEEVFRKLFNEMSSFMINGAKARIS